jgi:hypothetical protein
MVTVGGEGGGGTGNGGYASIVPGRSGGTRNLGEAQPAMANMTKLAPTKRFIALPPLERDQITIVRAPVVSSRTIVSRRPMAVPMATPGILNDRRILLIVGGGIAAYKACELVRLIRLKAKTRALGSGPLPPEIEAVRGRRVRGGAGDAPGPFAAAVAAGESGGGIPVPGHRGEARCSARCVVDEKRIIRWFG